MTFAPANDLPVPDLVATFPGDEKQSFIFRSDCTGLPTAALTVSIWVKLQSTVAQYFIVGCFAKGAGWYLGTSSTGDRFAFVLKSASTASPTLIVDSANTVIWNKWYYVTATYDGTQMRLYVDAKEVRASSQQTGAIGYAATGASFGLGRYQDATVNMVFKGVYMCVCVCMYVCMYV